MEVFIPLEIRILTGKFNDMKKISYCIVLIWVWLYGCRALKPLTLQKEDNITDSFRIDGFYFGEFLEGGYWYTQFFVFYKNGVFISFSNDKRDTAHNWTDYLKQRLSPNYYGAAPYWWGVYNIRNDSLKLERWVSTDYYYPTLLSAGKILNDTTLLWKSGEFGKDWKGDVSFSKKHQKLSERVDTLRFVKLEAKPDSTNNWIK